MELNPRLGTVRGPGVPEISGTGCDCGKTERQVRDISQRISIFPESP